MVGGGGSVDEWLLVSHATEFASEGWVALACDGVLSLSYGTGSPITTYIGITGTLGSVRGAPMALVVQESNLPIVSVMYRVYIERQRYRRVGCDTQYK